MLHQNLKKLEICGAFLPQYDDSFLEHFTALEELAVGVSRPGQLYDLSVDSLPATLKVLKGSRLRITFDKTSNPEAKHIPNYADWS